MAWLLSGAWYVCCSPHRSESLCFFCMISHTAILLHTHTPSRLASPPSTFRPFTDGAGGQTSTSSPSTLGSARPVLQGGHPIRRFSARTLICQCMQGKGKGRGQNKIWIPTSSMLRLKEEPLWGGTESCRTVIGSFTGSVSSKMHGFEQG